VETVLVAVDGDRAGVRAVETAIGIADRYDAGVHRCTSSRGGPAAARKR